MISVSMMNSISVNRNTTLQQIASAFAGRYPYLSLRFFRYAHHPREASDEKDSMGMEMTVGQLNPDIKAQKIVLQDQMSVEDFEQMIKEQLGLNVQVYRKSHGKWLQTWATDMWSLAEQNRRGEILGNN